MLRNVRAVPTPYENSEYPYEPAHPRSLVWALLSAANFHNKSLHMYLILNLIDRVSPSLISQNSPTSGWERTQVFFMHTRKILVTLGWRTSLSESWWTHIRTANIHVSLRIRAAWSGLSYMLKKCTTAWELSLRPMRIANIHMSLRFRPAWSGIRYLLEKKKSAETWKLSLRHMRIVNTNMSLCIRTVCSRLCCLLEKNALQHESSPCAPREQRIPIWACASAQPDLYFAVCWKFPQQKLI